MATPPRQDVKENRWVRPEEDERVIRGCEVEMSTPQGIGRPRCNTAQSRQQVAWDNYKDHDAVRQKADVSDFPGDAANFVLGYV